MKMMPLGEAKNALSAVVDEVGRTHQPVLITRHGRPAATLIATEDLDTLMETLAWLSDPDHAAEMAESQDDIDQNRTLTLDEVRAELASRR
jgi:prevent-host-death family protein